MLSKQYTKGLFELYYGKSWVKKHSKEVAHWVGKDAGTLRKQLASGTSKDKTKRITELYKTYYGKGYKPKAKEIKFWSTRDLEQMVKNLKATSAKVKGKPKAKPKAGETIPEFKFDKKAVMKSLTDLYGPHYKRILGEFLETKEIQRGRAEEEYGVKMGDYYQGMKDFFEGTGISKERIEDRYEEALLGAKQAYTEKGQTFSGIRQKGEALLEKETRAEPMSDIARQERLRTEGMERVVGSGKIKEWGYGGLGGVSGTLPTWYKQLQSDIARESKQKRAELGRAKTTDISKAYAGIYGEEYGKYAQYATPGWGEITPSEMKRYGYKYAPDWSSY